MSGACWEIGLTHWSALLERDLQRAARRAGGPERLWSASLGELAVLLNLPPGRIQALGRARRDLPSAAPHVARRDPAFPPLLAEIPDPPFLLFYREGGRSGLAQTLSRPCVAIVGSRRAHDRSLTFARRLASDLAEQGVVIVSGLARGIDAAAHRGALDVGGATVAVLGSGPDVIYPRSNAALAEAIASSGSVVSEYWPGTRPARWRFPARNRIIAGLSHVVVVVEAPQRSGALITADFALECGRSVLVTPGAPWSERFTGSNALLRVGAGVCEGVEDVAAEISAAVWTLGALPMTAISS